MATFALYYFSKMTPRSYLHFFWGYKCSVGTVEYAIVKQWSNRDFFLFIFIIFKHKFRKNFRLRRDSNSDRRNRRFSCWPLDHHHHGLYKPLFEIIHFKTLSLPNGTKLSNLGHFIKQKSFFVWKQQVMLTITIKNLLGFLLCTYRHVLQQSTSFKFR